MIADAALPPGAPPPATGQAERSGLMYTAARWTPEGLAAVVRRLAEEGAPALRAAAAEELRAAWSDTVAAFRDPAGAERRALADPLARLCRLSPSGLDAGLEAVLGGVAGEPADELFGAAAERRAGTAPGPVLVILASNLPALAVQPLLPALALRRQVLLKSSSAEPLFAPAFVRALVRRLPALAPGLAALTWPGGDTGLEAPLLATAGTVIAYGDDATLDDLERRVPAGRLVGFGARTSLAAVARDADLEAAGAGLARDVALFDQRGCLSVQAVYTDGDPAALARALAAGLADLAQRWPPGPLDPAAAAAVQQVRTEAAMRGLEAADLPLAAGTVVVEPEPRFRPSPGLRTVRVHPLDDLRRLPKLLEPWRGRLQGAALGGEAARALEPALVELGVTRCAAPGELQTPDALWHNGGAHPLEVLGSAPTPP